MIPDILCLPEWRVRSVEEKDDHLLIEAEVEEESFSCPRCGSFRPPYRFGKRQHTFLDLPIRMKSVRLLAHRQRYRCRDCGATFLTKLSHIDQKHAATERLICYVEQHALDSTRTFTALARELGVSERFVRDIFQARLDCLQASRTISTPEYLGIDEIYVNETPYCVLTDLGQHRLLEVLPKRDMQTVKRWLAQLSASNVRASCMDLWNPYRLAVRDVLPQAMIVADKWHILRLVNKVVEQVRKSVRASLSTKQQRLLKHDRKILLKRETDLTESERLILESWASLMPVLGELFEAKEEFYHIYEATTQAEAYARYVTWQEHLSPELYQAFTPLQLTLEEWGQEMFAFFTLPCALTNGYTERVNLAIRQAARISYGISHRTLRGKMIFSLANAPDSRRLP